MFNNTFCNFFVIHFKRGQTTQPIKSNVYLTKKYRENNVTHAWSWIYKVADTDLLRKFDKRAIKVRTFLNFLHRSLSVGPAVSVHPLQRSA